MVYPYIQLPKQIPELMSTQGLSVHISHWLSSSPHRPRKVQCAILVKWFSFDTLHKHSQHCEKCIFVCLFVCWLVGLFVCVCERTKSKHDEALRTFPKIVVMPSISRPEATARDIARASSMPGSVSIMIRLPRSVMLPIINMSIRNSVRLRLRLRLRLSLW